MRALFISAVLSLTAVSAASAASTASLRFPGTDQRLVVLDARVWRCAGVSCAAAGPGRSQGLLRECMRVARKLGPLTAYARDGVTLDAAGLERCNRQARVR
jgi:hypothetical protein